MRTNRLILSIITGVLLICLLVVLLLPTITRLVLVEVLQSQLQGTASIEAVDISLRRGAFSITAIEASDDALLALRSGTLVGDIRLRELLSGKFQGEFELADAVVKYGDLAIKLGRLHFKGELLQTGSEEAPEWLVKGDLALDALGLFDPVRELSLLSLGVARLNGLEFNTASTAVFLPRLVLEQIGAISPDSDESQWLYGEKFLITDLRYGGDLLEVDTIDGTGVRSQARLTAEGELESQGVLSTSLEALASQAPATEAPAEPSAFNFSFGYAVFRDSQIHFADQQFAEPLVVELLIDELSVGTVDSRQPDAATTLDLKSGIGEFSRINVNGSFAPLAEALTLDLDGEIDGLPLPLLSPFVEQLIGYQLTTGQFDHKFTASLADETLKADNKIKLHGLKVKHLEDAEPSAPLGLPLEAGLDMLRDSNGLIELDVPLEGHLDDPNIGLGQIISTALTSALSSGSTTFLKLALQPYGAIWMGAELGLKMLGKVHLDPMVFAPLEATLGSQQLDYTNKLGDLMLDRPGVSLSLCGVVGQADHAALLALSDKEASAINLPGLAKARASAVKSYLLDTRKIDTKRLHVCKAQVLAEGETSGVVLEI